MNDYITAPNKEKVWSLVGAEYGKDKGCMALVVRSFYDTKSASAAFRNYMAGFMRHLGYTSNKPDPNLWMTVCMSETKYSMKKYDSYILIYIDDILCVHDDSDSVLPQLDEYFSL